MNRGLWQIFHRWAGLVAMPFLVITGLTGAIISWDHELDDWLNPHLTQIQSKGQPLSILAIAKNIEIKHPNVRVTFIPLRFEPGESLAFGVQPKVNPSTNQLFEPGFNQVFVDPINGKELGFRDWGAIWPLNKENFVSFLYKFHYTLHLPEIAGIDRWGIWLLGTVAIIWTLDCFAALVLTLPIRINKDFLTRWWRSWCIKLEGSNYRLNYDIHRAFGLWTWILLLLIAFSAFALNLRREVFIPIVSSVSSLSKTPFELVKPNPKNSPIEPNVNFEYVIKSAQIDALNHKWKEPVGSVFYASSFGIYSVQFFYPEADHGVAGGGHKRIFIDGRSGKILGTRVPWTGSAADIFVQSQFPIHSGRILGLPGRVLISMMGIVVAMLSITGFYLWWKKRNTKKVVEARIKQYES